MEKYLLPEQERSMIENARVPMAVYQYLDRRVVTLALSAGFCELFECDNLAQAYDQSDHNMYRDTHPDDAMRVANAALRFATMGGQYDVTYRSRMRDSDRYRVIHAKGEHFVTESGVRLAQIWYMDEGEYNAELDLQTGGKAQYLNRRMREEEITQANSFDLLTGLPTMTTFFDFAEENRKNRIKDGESTAILYLDICGMRFYNRQYGFSAGNDLLRTFAGLLSLRFGSENCCRLGQDHFAVFTGEAGAEEGVRAFFKDWRQNCHGLFLPVRVGIFIDGSAGTHTSAACDKAKFACDTLRDTADSAMAFFDASMHENAMRKRYIILNLDRAMEEQWIRVYYQPIIRTVSGRVCNEEALARWFDPERGMLSSDQFLPALEEAGLIWKLDLYVVEQIMQQLDDGEDGKIILSDLMKMAISLGTDTLCEGVETERQLRFLREIGCSKLQGFYFSKPISIEEILKRYEMGRQIGFENPAESAYFETFGRLNLLDMASVAADEGLGSLPAVFGALPMGVLETVGERVRFWRSNQPYRDFMRRFFDADLCREDADDSSISSNFGAGFLEMVRQCRFDENRTYITEKMKDGSTVHSMIRRFAVNPVTGAAAIAVVVLSVEKADSGRSHADDARALAQDYRFLFQVNSDTDEFVDYSSVFGQDVIRVERHGRDFFGISREIALAEASEEDRDLIMSRYTKENILKTLEEQDSFTLSFRRMQEGAVKQVSLKAVRMKDSETDLMISLGETGGET